MANPKMSMRSVDDHGARYNHVVVWCPGCDDVHAVRILGADGQQHPPMWTWDANWDAPTFDPSILVNRDQGHPGKPVCHSYIRAGRWEFLSDCTHELAGQTVDMVPLPDWLAKETTS